MSWKDLYKNLFPRIFFNSIFITLTVTGLYLSFCDAFGYKGDYAGIFLFSMFISFIMSVLWIGSSLWNNTGLFIANLLLAVVIIRNYQLIGSESGIIYGYIRRQYLVYENIGKTSVNKAQAVTSLAGWYVNERLILIIIIVLVIMLLAMAALRMKWNFLVLAPVVIITGMGMFCGKAPSVASSCCFVPGTAGLLFGIRLDACGGRKNFWQEKYFAGQAFTRYLIFVAIMVFCISISFFVGRSTKEKFFKNSAAVLKKQHQIENGAGRLMEKIMKMGAGSMDGRFLDNDPPDQSGKFIMRVETDKKPADNIYIRAYTADVYDGGKWSRFTEDISPQDDEKTDAMYYNAITKLRYKRKQGYTDMYINLPENIEPYNIDIIYNGKSRKTLPYIPYMAEISGLNNAYAKNLSSGTSSFKCYNITGNVKTDILSMPVDEASLYNTSQDRQYDEYVYKHYLEVPGRLKRLRKFADDINTDDNLYLQCMAVKRAICKDTRYSQDLKKLPLGDDYIEYFLFVQKKGYCKHYATTGAVLLRMKGTPARYASGYNVIPSQFTMVSDSSGNIKYVAYVSDYNAHAWTEVYKKGFGWLPFDMTNPVTDENYTGHDVLPAETADDSLQETGLEDTEKISQTPAREEDQQDKKEKDGKETQLPEGQEKDNAAGSHGKDGNNRWNTLCIKIVFIVVALMVVAMVPVIYTRINLRKYFKKFRQAGTYNRKALICFGIFNRFLGLCKIRGLSNLSDAEYNDRLYSIFAPEIQGEEINRVCGILLCSAFSNKEIKKEEMEEVFLFIRDASGKAFAKCNIILRLIVLIMTGRRNISFN